jgi:hypothetical protein
VAVLSAEAFLTFGRRAAASATPAAARVTA